MRACEMGARRRRFYRLARGEVLSVQWVLVGVAVVVGMFIPLQPGINAEMKLHTGNAFSASLISFLGGTLVLALVVACLRVTGRSEWPGIAEVIRTAPWWAYLGGLVGAMFVTVAVLLAPRLGAAMLVAGIVTGQLVGSVVIDHFALVGFPRVSVTWPRVVGVGLLISGVLVMQLSGRGVEAG